MLLGLVLLYFLACGARKLGRHKRESPLHVLYYTKLPNLSSGKIAHRIQKPTHKPSAGRLFRVNEKSRKLRRAQYVDLESRAGRESRWAQRDF